MGAPENLSLDFKNTLEPAAHAGLGLRMLRDEKGPNGFYGGHEKAELREGHVHRVEARAPTCQRLGKNSSCSTKFAVSNPDTSLSLGSITSAEGRGRDEKRRAGELNGAH